MIEPLVILGRGGHGRELLELILALNAEARRYELLGFVDDAATGAHEEVHGYPVLGTRAWLAARSPAPLVALGVGVSAARARVVAGLASLGVRFPTLVHPRASVGRHVRMDEGVIVCDAAAVTTDVTLGAHAHVNVAASVSHDCVLGRFVSLAPGVRLAGNVRLGDGCDVGVAASAIPGVEVGEWSIIGGGAVLTASLPANVTAVGVPARVTRTRPPGWQLRTP